MNGKGNGGPVRPLDFRAFSRKELIADIPLTAIDNLVTLPTNGGLIPNDRYMYGLDLTFEGRLTNNAAANNPTGTEADAPFSLLENIRVSGTHRQRGNNEVFINLRGADLQALNRVYGNYVPYMEPSVAGWPGFAPNLSLAGDAANDIRFNLFLPFTPLNIPINMAQGFLLDAPNYENLKLEINYSDWLSVFNGGTPGAFSAFGSPTGNPRIRVHGYFALGNGSEFGFIPARTWRYFTEVVSGDIVSGATASRLMNIPRGYLIRSLLLKTGTKSTTVTAGNNSYATVSDVILSNIQVMRGLNKMIRRYGDYRSIKFEDQQSYGMYPAAGYALLDWVKHGRLSEALQTSGLIAGPSGDTDTFIQADITAGAAQAALMLIEEIRGVPHRMTGAPA